MTAVSPGHKDKGSYPIRTDPARENNRVVQAHIIPLQNETGEWLVAEFKVDITRSKGWEKELQQALEELDAERHILEDVLESTLAGYWDWNLVDNTQYLSPAFKKMFATRIMQLPNKPEKLAADSISRGSAPSGKLLEEHFASRGRYPLVLKCAIRHKEWFHHLGHLYRPR